MTSDLQRSQVEMDMDSGARYLVVDPPVTCRGVISRETTSLLVFVLAVSRSARRAFGAKARILVKGDNEVVIVAAVRSAPTKVPRALETKHLYTRTHLSPALIDEIADGNVLPPGGGWRCCTRAYPTLHRSKLQRSSGLADANQATDQIIGQTSIGIILPEAMTARETFGKAKDKIVRLQVQMFDPKTEKQVEIVVEADDGIRDGVTSASLAKVKPSFKEDGSTHASMPRRYQMVQQLSYQLVDLLPNRSDFRPLANHGHGSHICNSQKFSKKAGRSKDDIDFYEVDEEFASQAIYSIEKIGIPFDNVNVNGSMIAMVHPLGCSTYIPLPRMVKSTLPTSQSGHIKSPDLNIARQRIHSDTTHEETGQHQVHSQLSSDNYGLGKNFSEVPQYLMMYITPEIQAQRAHFHCEYLYTSMNVQDSPGDRNEEKPKYQPAR
ncbi:hypothetical protein F5J12DRAFT_781807 [Pisolithus orientalis]|uniref:uncharacterized protein n=1 Tax=Pisolithus orientalis TaxID=936130 RepID=UPI002224C2C6|nr:uncharacterized protein F5J12DRAFT_781807 [Pisolithus orientalis]KAI6010829.1 hypothetical protein F5J12DRAFT_781807 [Pisolithus orientalis]